MTLPRHPLQPVVKDEHGTVRFHENAIVSYLLHHGRINLNQIALIDFPQEDRCQFAQLIGYSVSGYHELSYVSDEHAAAASSAARAAFPELFTDKNPAGCRDVKCGAHCGVPREV